jgi:hypothetical protein
VGNSMFPVVRPRATVLQVVPMGFSEGFFPEKWTGDIGPS